MIVAQVPEDETARLAALHDYAILDTPPEDSFDDLVVIAAQIFAVPTALVSLVDRERQWFKARHGLNATETPRDSAFCAHAILDPGRPLVVEDALRDDRFFDNPLVVGAPHIRFYAGAPLVTPNGRALGTLCVIAPVAHSPSDAQREALSALARQVVAQLELRRTAAEQRKTSAELAQAQRAKDEFLAGISHELRTPLHAVIGYAQALRESPLRAEQREQVRRIWEAGCSLADEVDHLLDLRSLQASEFGGGLAPTDVTRVARGVTRQMQYEAGRKGVTLSVQAPRSRSVAYANPAHLRQVVVELMGNAIKFTGEGSVSVHVRQLDTGIRVDVADTGMGMTAEQRARVFSSFEQSNATSERHPAPSGLGLAGRLVEHMGGQLHCDSEPGKGSNFWFELPSASPARQDHAGTPGTVQRAPSPDTLRDARVLVVEDNPVNREVASLMLKKIGCRVWLAESGEEAVEQVRSQSFDVVLMDFHLPGIDGAETTRQLRAVLGDGTPPVLALTATATETDIRACQAVGMREHLTKPLRSATLRSSLARALKPRNASESVAGAGGSKSRAKQV